ncbi:MAG: hypothetical protein ACK4QL_03910 [Pseudanabaenaceae cyanobacterium]
MQLLKPWQAIPVVLGIVSAPALVMAETFQTDQDAFPRNFPATYVQTIKKVLDMTSSPNLPPLFELRDQVIFRQNNAFRSIIRDMLDMQTLSTPTVRTRDLPTAYCTTLLTEGFDPCRPLPPEPVATPPPEPIAPPPPEPIAPPPPPPPVPALW